MTADDAWTVPPVAICSDGGAEGDGSEGAGGDEDADGDEVKGGDED